MPKSDQEKAETRQQTEARRQADKDRSEHETARGKKAVEQTLIDLSRDMLTEAESEQFLAETARESDRGLALLSGSLVEVGLLWSIYARLPDLGEKEKRKTAYDVGAPLASFSSKIKMGRAMGVYGPVTESALNEVRAIRNAFAHALRPLTFKNPTISREVGRLTIPYPLTDLRLPDDARERFRLICNGLYGIILKNGIGYGRRNFEILLP